MRAASAAPPPAGAPAAGPQAGSEHARGPVTMAHARSQLTRPHGGRDLNAEPGGGARAAEGLDAVRRPRDGQRRSPGLSRILTALRPLEEDGHPQGGRLGRPHKRGARPAHTAGPRMPGGGPARGAHRPARRAGRVASPGPAGASGVTEHRARGGAWRGGRLGLLVAGWQGGDVSAGTHGQAAACGRSAPGGGSGQREGSSREQGPRRPGR